MIPTVQFRVIIIFIQVLVFSASTDPKDFAILKILQLSWKNLPPNWTDADPCGDNWEGITCRDSRVIAIILSGIGLTGTSISDLSSFTALEQLDLSNNIGLKGPLSPSIGDLKNLTTLILVGCGFFGPIPNTIGSLQQLVFLSLNTNQFNGQIPPSIGNLSKLSWLDLSVNQLTGTIPVSNETSSGLDMLLNARHFHLSKNKLSGIIPPQLFNSSMKLLHVMFDNNLFVGNVPQTLGLVKSLEVIRLDWNSLNGSVPKDINGLTNMTDFYLSNNKLNGPIPNFTGMDFLSYVDMSNNSFDESEFPLSFTRLLSLTTLLMENTRLKGPIPVNFFSLPQLQTVALGNNKLNESLDIGETASKDLTLNLRNNSIDDFKQKSSYNINLTLIDNPICQKPGATQTYCSVQKNNSFFVMLNTCPKTSCKTTLSPNCTCSYPYSGTLHFFSSSFSDLENLTYYNTLNDYLKEMFDSNNVSVEGFNISNPSIDASYLLYNLQLFPSGEEKFNRTATSSINFLLNRQSRLLNYFGPFFFIEDSHTYFTGDTNASIHPGIKVGVPIGISILVLFVIVASIYAFQQRKIARTAINKSNPFASWDIDKGYGAVPQLNGAQSFTFDELKKLTNNFSESNCIGVGGYGKVYKGALISGQLVAIKRAQPGSLQGATEFKTEIELLSRIHHINVVRLVGFCYEQGEQMLVYEYIQNGTLSDSLSGKSGIRLDWIGRLKIGLGAAKGLLYLHELADPPIIHRDIKSNNILLDNNLNAKVADFGLSKLIGDSGQSYVITQVKGTMGYMDPEYFMTEQLTEKSDVYSFGVVLLELVTARAPIERGKHIVRLIQEALDNPNDLDKLYQFADLKIGPGSRLGGFEKFIELAMWCVRDSSADRPTMSEVARQIENIIELASSDDSLL